MTVRNCDQINISKITKALRAHGVVNDKSYFFERIEFENGFIVERNFILTSDGWEESKVIPNGGRNVELMCDHPNQMKMMNSETKEVLGFLDRVEPITFAGAFNLIIKAEDKDKWREEEKRLEILKPTQDDFEILVSKIKSNPNVILTTITEFVDQLEDKRQGAVKRKLFKGVDDEVEFGVSRLISDRVYHLPKLLEKLGLKSEQANSYKLHSQATTSVGSVGLEYFFEASNDDEAKNVAAIFKRKIFGVGERLWLASWDIANEAGSWLFEVDTYDLYRKCHPERKAEPNGEERNEFFNLIRLLERTKFNFTRKNKKQSSVTYELPIIQIFSFEGSSNSSGWPRRLKLQVLPPSAVADEMAHVGAHFHRKTLHLDHSDIHLASMLQTRRSQCKNADCVMFSLEDLIKGSGLQNTYEAKPNRAIKLLGDKLERFKKEGIIKSYPSKLTSKLKDKIIINFFIKISEV